MRNLPLVVTAFLFAASSCGSEPAAKVDAGHLLPNLPKDADTFRITFNESTRPNWTVEGEDLQHKVANRIEVRKGRAVQLVLGPDRDCRLEIPAAHVELKGYTNRYQVAFLMPVEPGEYDAWIEAGGKRHEGKLVIVSHMISQAREKN